MESEEVARLLMVERGGSKVWRKVAVLWGPP